MKSTKEGSYSDILSDARVRIDGLIHENIKLRSEVKLIRKALSNGMVVHNPSYRMAPTLPVTLSGPSVFNAQRLVVDHYNKSEGKYNKMER